MGAISFIIIIIIIIISSIIIIIILKTQGHPTWFPPKCIENTFKAVQSTFDLKMHSKQRLHKFSQKG